LTVFAGVPTVGDRLTEWDARCGFGSAAEAVMVRRDEDRRAQALVEADPVWLDFSDSQYGESPDHSSVAAALERTLTKCLPGPVLFPIGLFHSDHRLVHDACVAALRGLPGATALLYEDALYRALPGLLHRRLAELAEGGWQATPVGAGSTNPGRAASKARAVRAYASQLRAFGPGGTDDLAEPERIWRLERLERQDGERATR
jgi:LmbE family N-acetylglucosaminyl deacetylase